jgi:hypothetical protein
MEREAATAQLRANFYENVGGDEYVIEVPVPGLEQSEIVIEADPESLVVRTEPRERAETEGAGCVEGSGPFVLPVLDQPNQYPRGGGFAVIWPTAIEREGTCAVALPGCYPAPWVTIARRLE